MLAAVAALPGVDAAFTSVLPLEERTDRSRLRHRRHAPDLQAADRRVSLGGFEFFKTLSIPIRRGRVHGSRSRAGSAAMPAVVRGGSARAWPGRTRRETVQRGVARPFEVVRIVPGTHDRDRCAAEMMCRLHSSAAARRW
jgi:hypothetical protein